MSCLQRQLPKPPNGCFWPFWLQHLFFGGGDWLTSLRGRGQLSVPPHIRLVYSRMTEISDTHKSKPDRRNEMTSPGKATMFKRKNRVKTFKKMEVHFSRSNSVENGLLLSIFFNTGAAVGQCHPRAQRRVNAHIQTVLVASVHARGLLNALGKCLWNDSKIVQRLHIPYTFSKIKNYLISLEFVTLSPPPHFHSGSAWKSLL